MATAWKVVNELIFAGPASDEAIECAVAALVPAGPWWPLLRPSLANSLLIAIWRLQRGRAAPPILLQCLLSEGEPVPTAQCGWSFFLVEKTSAGAHCGQGVVQVYLFQG